MRGGGGATWNPLGRGIFSPEKLLAAPIRELQHLLLYLWTTAPLVLLGDGGEMEVPPSPLFAGSVVYEAQRATWAGDVAAMHLSPLAFHPPPSELTSALGWAESFDAAAREMLGVTKC